MRVFLFVAFLAFSMASVQAEPLGPAEQASLNATRTQFVEALQNKDYDIIVSVIPPKILSHIAASAGATPAQLLAELPKIMKQTMTNVSFGKADIVTEDLDATKEDFEGAEYTWGFAPSTFEMTVNGQKLRSVGQTLVLRDAGKWYLVRTSEADKVALMRTIYPFFATVEFPTELTAPVQ